MSSLTGDFLANRNRLNRYKRFILPAAIFLLIALLVAAGFYLFEKSDKNSLTAKAAASTLPKEWVAKYFGVKDENDSRVGGPQGDPDADILTNEQEFFFGTDPTNADSDSDGQGDGAEVAGNSHPLGEGELYSTEYAKRIAEAYLKSNELDEFTEEGIQKQVEQILRPVDPGKVQLALPDVKTLKVSSDNSPQAVEDYFAKSGAIIDSLAFTNEDLQLAMQNPAGSDFQNILSLLYQTANKFRELPAPSSLTYYHQLRLASIFASANVMEISKTIDQTASPETQAGKYQEQYYQAQVVEKIDSLRIEEWKKIQDSYPEVIAKYESQPVP